MVVNTIKAVGNALIVKPVTAAYRFGDRRVEAAGDSLIDKAAHNTISVGFDVLGNDDKGIIGYLKSAEQILKGSAWTVFDIMRLRFGKVFTEDLAQIAGGVVNIGQNTVTTPIAVVGHTAKAAMGVLGAPVKLITGKKEGSGRFAANIDQEIHNPNWGQLAA